MKDEQTSEADAIERFELDRRTESRLKVGKSQSQPAGDPNMGTPPYILTWRASGMRAEAAAWRDL